MYRGLIDHLAFVYGFIYKGRGKMDAGDMKAIANGAHTLVMRAPAVLGGEMDQADDRADLAAAKKMDEQIDEAVVFLTHMEII